MPYMSYARLQSLPHIAKSIQPSAEGILRRLHELDRRKPTWSYDLSWRLAVPLYSGRISQAAALKACRKIKDSVGAKSNAEVVSILWDDAQRASYLCHPLKDRLFPIRHDLVIPVRPRFYFVKDGSVHLFWLQPWKRFELTEEQLGILASVIKQTFVVDDFEDANLYLLDTSADEGDEKRSPEVFGFDDLPLLSDDALKAAFDRFAVAYDIFVAERQPKAERPRPELDQRQQRLFD